MKNLKVCIATPAGGGQVNVEYVGSLLPTVRTLRDAGIDYRYLTLRNESLVPRARNKCAAYALSDDFTHIFFIDSDVSWSPQDALRLFDRDLDIVGGVYPVKNYPIQLNFNPLPEHKNKYGVFRRRRNYIEYVKTYADEGGLVEVSHLATGFLLIKTDVFRKMIEEDVVEPYQSYDPQTKQKLDFHEFFPSGAVLGNYLSEDWAFCELARALGFKIHLQTRSICSHTGTVTFDFFSEYEKNTTEQLDQYLKEPPFNL